MDGILLIDKPLFYTSHDVVDALRRHTGISRIGHGGTLDPLATGLLVLLVGRATSLFDRVSRGDKEYEGVMTLGMRTDTQDLEGRILEWRPAGSVPPRAVEEVFEGLRGVRKQKVPRFSSARFAGKKCYEMARKRIDFVPPEKTVEIKTLELLAVSEEDVYFRVRASAGTYVRALCDEVGERLGTGACLGALRRIGSGDFHVRDSVPLGVIRSLSAADLRRRLVTP